MSLSPTNKSDVLIALALGLVATFVLFWWVDFSLPPFEDAAMLMRYAAHWAGGHGIVWNIGEQPLDGATDFLYMIFLGCLIKLGASPEAASLLLGFGAHAITTPIVYLALRRLQGLSVPLAVATTLWFAAGPAKAYVQAGFGTPFFALAACVTWCFALELAKDPTRRAPHFALSALVMGLIRPEGVFLAGFMLVAIVFHNGLANSRQVIAWFVGVFAVLGGGYFAWRWRYFGHPLPNPFYKKGGGHLYPASLVDAAVGVAKQALPFWPFFLLALGRRQQLKELVFVLIPVAGFTSLWLLLSNEMNYASRFQYALLPVVLMSWPIAWKALAGTRWHIPERVLAGAVIVLAVASAGLQWTLKRTNGPFPDGRYDVALKLNAFESKGYAIATTEAGLLPLYSHWRAIDAWGLNDRWIAHHGEVTAEYLEEQHPQVIMVHRVGARDHWAGDAWSRMTKTLDDYAKAHQFVLAADFSPDGTDGHLYYVASGLPDTAALVEAIGRTPYHWYGSGALTSNRASR